jgi:phosphatidate cytidylyltransferase
VPRRAPIQGNHQRQSSGQMTKSRQNVVFQHRSANGSAKLQKPTSSISDLSEAGSDRGGLVAAAEDEVRLGLTKLPYRLVMESSMEGYRKLTHCKQKTLPVPPPSEYEKKKQTFITRTIWTLIMIGIFFGAMFAGHIYIIIIVTAVQIISFKEVINISNVPSRARSLRFTKSLNWYFLGTTMYFLYGESVIYYFKHIILVDRVLLPFATHHRFISFMLYVTGNVQLLTQISSYK